MNESLSTEFFVNTTDEDQLNYFFGLSSTNISLFLGNERILPLGNYRVINGQLCRIISGLSPEDVRQKMGL